MKLSDGVITFSQLEDEINSIHWQTIENKEKSSIFNNPAHRTQAYQRQSTLSEYCRFETFISFNFCPSVFIVLSCSSI